MPTKPRVYATEYQLRNIRAMALGYKSYSEERRRYKSISDSLVYKDLTPEQYKVATARLREVDAALVKQRDVPGDDRHIPAGIKANIYGDFKKFLPVTDIRGLMKELYRRPRGAGYYGD